MKRPSHKFILALFAIFAIGGLLYYLYAGRQTPSHQPPLIELTPETITSFEKAFNASQGEVRVLLLLSPT